MLYSTDGGSTWTLLKELALTHEFTQYTYGLDVTDNVRFKFQQTVGARVNIDDIAIYAPQQPQNDPQVYFDGAIQALTAEQDGESSISEVTVVTEYNDQPVIVTVNDNFELSLDQQTWMAELTLDPTGETFYVRLASTAVEGSFEGIITATAGTATAYADIEGEVTAPDFLLGDVDMDGEVGISDVSALIDYILTGSADPFNVHAADMDQDETVGISDVSSLIDYLLVGSKAATKWIALPASGGIKVDNAAGEVLEVYDLDANLVATVSGATTIEVPAGIYLVTSATCSRKVVVK